jgi:hypothetical protein
VARRREKRVDPSNLRSSIWLHDRRTGTTMLVSRATGVSGAVAGGYSSEPAVSADGARVVFTSTAGNLSAGKPFGLAGVFVRDLRRSTTTLLSERGTTSGTPVAQQLPAPLNSAYVCPLEPWHHPDAGTRRKLRAVGALRPLVPAALYRSS